MTISGKNKIELEDILIGEVWIGSGQSNMEFGLGGSIGGKEAVAAANCPQIRLLHVEKVQTPQPAKDIVVAGGAKGKKGQPAPPAPTGPAWKVCTPQTVPGFSAVLYYFGQRLHKDLDVPVGLINSSWGGSPIEAVDRFGTEGRRHVQRHDRPPGAVCDSRRDLVSGRIQRQQRPEVLRQDEGPDRGLAEGLGLRLPLLLRRDCALVGLQSAACPPLGSPGGQPQDPRHRHGGDDRLGETTSRTSTPRTSSTWATAWPSGRWPRTTARRTSSTRGRSTSR